MDATFPKFNHLPPELRCKIWRHALPQRTIYFRLKMNMDAWRWAPETDWWAHYLLIGDYNSTATPRPRPALLLVNHEARAESLKAYRRLQVDKDVLKKCLADDSVDDRRLERMRNLTRTPKFSLDTDILEWAHVKRWSRNNPASCAALFLAASMSVQHITVEYDYHLHNSLVALAFAVLDVKSPLRSLTIKVPATCSAEYYCFRIVQLPEHMTILGRADNVIDMLHHHQACMLPGFRQYIRDTERLQTRTVDQATSDSFTGPLSAGAKLDSQFAIYRVLSQYDLDWAEARPNETSFVPAEEVTQRWNLPLVPDEEKRNPFNTTNLQGDVALFLHRLALHEDMGYGVEPNEFVPFHGLCLPQYGLPA
jgi:hypothetical protein